ncbi:MAG: hydrogenase maturation protease [Candidatus Zixiibacteriota bacterium]
MLDILVLGLGNELLADDAVGVEAVRHLKKDLDGRVSLVDSPVSGMALLDLLAGYEKAIIIDAVQTGCHPVGTVLELTSDDIGSVIAPSPHYSGLPEVTAVAKRLGIDFPSTIKIFAVEVADTCTLGGEISTSVKLAIKDVASRITKQVANWRRELCHA